MADLPPNLSSDDEEEEAAITEKTTKDKSRKDHVVEEDDESDDGMDTSFQFGGILVRLQNKSRPPSKCVNWESSSQCHMAARISLRSFLSPSA